MTLIRASLQHVSKVFVALLGLVVTLTGIMSPANAQGLIRDAEIEELLREFATPLFVAGGLNPNDVDLYIVNDPTLNAFVSGGQNMFFHTGFLTRAESPAEIIGVMAHETGHITGGHNVTRTQAMQSAMGSSWIALGLGVLAVAAGAPEAGVAIMAGSQQTAALTFFKYTRIEESSADQTALKLLEATGMPADGLVSFMEEIRHSEVLSAARQDPYYRTHPETGPRIAALRQSAARISKAAKPLPENYVPRMERMQAKLIGFLQPRSVFSKYPLTDTSIPARYARAIAAHQTQDMTSAIREIETLVELEPDNPWFQELHGQILFENGKFVESIAPHRRSVELAPDESLLYVNLARSLITTKSQEAYLEAEQLLHKALVLEPGNAYAWRQMSYALGALNRKPEAELATAEAAYAIGDVQQANMFAQRALNGLPEGSILATRADDIAAATDPRLAGWGRRPNGSRQRVHLDLIDPNE